jgi:hypothetical protein
VYPSVCLFRWVSWENLKDISYSHHETFPHNVWKDCILWYHQDPQVNFILHIFSILPHGTSWQWSLWEQTIDTKLSNKKRSNNYQLSPLLSHLLSPLFTQEVQQLPVISPSIPFIISLVYLRYLAHMNNLYWSSSID